MDEQKVALNEYDKDEWKDICLQEIDLSEEKFEELWQTFQELKTRKQLQ